MFLQDAKRRIWQCSSLPAHLLFRLLRMCRCFFILFGVSWSASPPNLDFTGSGGVSAVPLRPRPANSSTPFKFLPFKSPRLSIKLRYELLMGYVKNLSEAGSIHILRFLWLTLRSLIHLDCKSQAFFHLWLSCPWRFPLLRGARGLYEEIVHVRIST